MAAIPLNLNSSKIRCGAAGYLWSNVQLPAESDELPLVALADGTMVPDDATSPNAVNLGMTSAGTTINVAPETNDFNADEFPTPVKQAVTSIAASFETQLTQIEDHTVLQEITRMFSTYELVATPLAGHKFTFGVGQITPVPVALIWPTTADPTKYAYCMFYAASNTGGLNGITISRAATDPAATSTTFEALAVTSRSPADSIGQYFLPS